MPPPLIAHTREEFITNLICIFVILPFAIFCMFHPPSTWGPHMDLTALSGPQVLVSVENGTAKFKGTDGDVIVLEIDTRGLEVGATYAVEDHPFRGTWGLLHNYSLKKLQNPMSFTGP